MIFFLSLLCSIHQAQTMSLDTDNIYKLFLPRMHSDDHLEAGVSSYGKIQILASGLKKFSLDDLRNATRNFEYKMRLDGGEFGEVFEGWIESGKVFEGELGTRILKQNTFFGDGILRIAVKRFYHSKIERHLLWRVTNLTL